MNNVILHAFNWSYALIADRAADIARAGYGAVLFPPPLYSDDFSHRISRRLPRHAVERVE